MDAAVRAPLLAHVGALIWALGLVLLFYYLLFYLGHTARLAGYPYDVDQGEGYDLNSGWLLAQGRPIYNDNNVYPYYSSNYPPVFSLLLAPLVALTGPVLGVGRLLSASAALLTALTIAVVVHRRTACVPAAATAGLLYVGSNYVYHVTPLARVNALAALFALLGLYCCLRQLERPGRAWLVGVVIAFLLAMFTKPTTLDAVAAGLVALLLRDRRSGVVASLAVGLVGGGLFLLLDVLHDGQFLVNVVVGNVNPFIPAQALAYYRNFLGLHGVAIALAAWAAWDGSRRRAWGPFELYWVLALILAVSVGKWGAGESYFLAPIVATSVLAGSALAATLEGSAHPRLLAVAGSLVLLQAGLLTHGPLERLSPLLADRGIQASALARAPSPADLGAASPLVELLRDAERPVLSEDPGYSLAAGKEVVGNATHLRNLHESGAWSPAGLVGDLAARRFGFVVLDAELYPEPVLEAVGRYYYLYEEYAIYETRQQLFAPGSD